MIRSFIPGALATGLAATVISAAEPPPSEAATPAVEISAPAKPDAKSVKDDSSYALGYRMGHTFSQQFGRFGVGIDDLEMQTFLKGFTAAVKGDQPELQEERLQAAMQALGDLLQTREKEAAAANLEAGKKFLEENAKREGVITTKSGLQYEIIEKGGDEKYVAPKDGAEDNKQFLVHYKGTLIDGREFDSSPPGQPVPMTLQVVEGFKEALTMMPVGAKYRFWIPSQLAYGSNGAPGGMIGPDATLTFDVELLGIAP